MKWEFTSWGNHYVHYYFYDIIYKLIIIKFYNFLYSFALFCIYFVNVPFLVPLVSRMCPSDTYKVWKCGKNIIIYIPIIKYYCYMFCFDYISCKEICCQIKK